MTPLGSSLVDRHEDPQDVLERFRVTRPYVLSVGTLEPRKNLVRLVRAYRQVAPDVPHMLVLAGAPGWHADALDAELARPGPGTIVRTNEVSDGELDVLYRGADVFAYPSLYEGFGLPVVEAMARGVPTLTSDISSLPEVAGDAALLVDPTDVSEIAEGLAKLADGSRVRGGPAAARSATCGDVHVGGDGARYARRLPAADGSIDVVKVSLISTVKDASAHVEEFVGSVAAQTRAPDEVIVVDGGSTDGTPDLLRRAGVEAIDRDRGARREHRARPQRRDRRRGARRARRDRCRLRARPAVARADPGADRGRGRRVDGVLRPRSRTGSCRSAWRR